MAQTPVYDWPNMISRSLSFQRTLHGRRAGAMLFFVAKLGVKDLVLRYCIQYKTISLRLCVCFAENCQVVKVL